MIIASFSFVAGANRSATLSFCETRFNSDQVISAATNEAIKSRERGPRSLDETIAIIVLGAA